MEDFSALPLVVLAEKFAALPGIGMKTAQRLAYAVMEMPEEEAAAFAEAILNAKHQIHDCPVCQNLTEQPVCSICDNPKRDRTTICVVEGPKDVAAIERTHEYHGLYHVLHGLISPLDGIGAEQLRVAELLKRIQAGGIEELIMATNPSVEGEATAMYLSRLCKPLGVRVTRLAFGLPVGGVIEYTDEVTLYRALSNRSEM
ncbi:MAG: recombination protein RecR [Oscillospiraceae bacterium]|nr:recombination protein RecR [Oscillospiraceae bacterium]MBQ9908103.1 recombination protein RecR [Oscillospiraceae bacterium]MBR5362750.1 recombination protein RecR [Oscillospiraceae bacterium]